MLGRRRAHVPLDAATDRRAASSSATCGTSSIERGLSANTVAAYRRDLTPFVEQLRVQGVTEPDQLTPDVVDLADTARARRRSVRAAARARLGRPQAVVGPRLHAVPRRGGRARGRSRARRSRPPKQTQRLPKALTIEQVERLLAATDGDEPARLRDKALLELLYATGARVSEAVALNVDDLVGLDGPNEVVRLLGKGNKQRIVPVGSYARAAIEAYLVRARPLLSARGHVDARAVPRRARLAASAAERVAHHPGRRRARAARRRAVAAQPAALLRDAPARGRRRRAGRAGTARPRVASRRRSSTRWSPPTRCATCTDLPPAGALEPSTSGRGEPGRPAACPDGGLRNPCLHSRP